MALRWVRRVFVRIANGRSTMTVIPREHLRLLATVAHELRGPLSALETASELLDRDLESLDDEQIRLMVSGIRRRAVWMRGLLENLLCTAAIREGRLRVQSRPLDIVAAIGEVESVVRPLFDRKRQTIRVVAPPTYPLVEADAHRIAQVLLNLLSNAHKYASAGTQIEVAVSMRAGAARVSVSDRGPGLPEAALRSAFRAYDRAGRSGGEGMGIGLWVVRSIIRAHGGRVGAFNREGGGATFWFELRPMVGRPAANAVIATGVSAAAERVSAV
jgi:signal transduction histidine kinase